MMLLQRIERLLQKKAVVLMYHRIAEPPTDPWLLSVSPAHFEQQLQVLCSRYKVISLQELITQHTRGTITSKSVCLTFDDGYRDNYLVAKPLLEKYGCPAVFFLPTHFIGSNQLFWWDELEQIMLRQPRLPVTFNLVLQGQPFAFELADESLLTLELQKKHQVWSAYTPPPTRRCQLYYTLWEKIRPLPLPEAVALTAQIRQWAAPTHPASDTDLPINARHLHGLQSQPLCSIGLHTDTHPDLASHSAQVQRSELVESIRYFQNNLGQQVHTLAYPYGRYNNTTLSLAKELDLQAAFTTFDEPVTKHADRHQLGRFQVQNWQGDKFGLQMRRWTKTWFDW